MYENVMKLSDILREADKPKKPKSTRKPTSTNKTNVTNKTKKTDLNKKKAIPGQKTMTPIVVKNKKTNSIYAIDKDSFDPETQEQVTNRTVTVPVKKK